MKKCRLFAVLFSIFLITSCNFEALLNIETLEWAVSGIIENGSALDENTKLAAFYRYGSGQNSEPGDFDSPASIVSDILQAEEGSDYILNISAPSYETFEDHSNYIDLLFWIDTNSNDSLDDGEFYAPVISANPEESVFPFWISFYSYGERDSSIGPVNWEAYSKELVPVSYLDMANTDIKAYDWYEYRE